MSLGRSDLGWNSEGQREVSPKQASKETIDRSPERGHGAGGGGVNLRFDGQAEKGLPYYLLPALLGVCA